MTPFDELGKELQLAWAAGFFDGEGCFHAKIVRKRNKLVVNLSLNQVDSRVLERFALAVGIGSVRGPYYPPSKQKAGAKPFYIYNVQGVKAKQIAQRLWPYLGEPKREQYRRVIDKVAQGLI